MWLFSIFSIFTKLSQLFQLTLTSCAPFKERERNIFHIMKQMNDKCVDSNNQQRRKIYSKIFFHQSFFHIQMWEREFHKEFFFFHLSFFIKYFSYFSPLKCLREKKHYRRRMTKRQSQTTTTLFSRPSFNKNPNYFITFFDFGWELKKLKNPVECSFYYDFEIFVEIHLPSPVVSELICCLLL